MSAKVCYELMRPDEVLAVRDAKPLAYLPVGTIEWHGPQNPLGLDGLTAHELAIRAATRAGGLVFPPVWYGEHREIMLVDANDDSRDEVADAMKLPRDNFRKGYMGNRTIEQQAHFYNELLFHCYHQIASLGFKAIFVVIGHYPLEHFVNFTSQVFMRESKVRVYGVTPAMMIMDQAKTLGGRIGDHAGRWETSVLMAMRPELVDLTKMNPDRKTWPTGCGGEDPRDSDKTFGQRGVDAMIDAMATKAADLLRLVGAQV